jgi:CelD/BcsL family acetyltransferase involved in cellulose biosynthesis
MAAAAMVEEIYTTDDASDWDAALAPSESAFGQRGFATLLEHHSDHTARLYVLRDGDSLIAYPFMVRPIHPPILSAATGDRLSDTLSPDFTGPLSRGTPSRALAGAFAQRLSRFLRRQHVVAEFIHLHPWKACVAALRPQCLQTDRQIVYVDLTESEEQWWRSSFNHACRKNINRSIREEVRVFEAHSTADIREFYRLYIQTMKNRHALEHYFFPIDYFTAIFEQLSGSARFALAEWKDRIVAGTLYLHDRDDVYSYLGGADPDFQHVRPTNAIIYQTMQWGRQHGKKRLILGGGYSENDGIFRFKASFSGQRAAFQVYRRVHLFDKYDALCRSWSDVYGQARLTGRYFPQYRVQPDAESRHAVH